MKLVFYTFITIYSYIKLLFGIQPGLIKKAPYPAYLLIHTCLFIISIIIMSCLSFGVLIIQIFLFGLDLWLILKLGKNYGGRLPGTDAMFEVAEEKTAIASLLILNHNENDDYEKRIQEFLKKIHDSSPKLSCIVKNCLGFSYYVKNQVKSSDCCIFTKINDKDCLSRDEIFDYIKTNRLRSLCNGKNLWYGEIFTQKVSWNEKSHQKILLMVFRHCLGDGPALLGLVNKFATTLKQPINSKINQKYNAKPAFSLDDVYVYHNIFKPENEGEHFDIINNERLIAFYAESNIKYFPLTKTIKNKLGMGFTAVLAAALTASLEKVLDKRGKKLDKCKVAVVFRPIDENLVSIINGTYDYSNLRNNSTIIAVNSPVTMQKGSKMMDRVKSVREEMSKAKYSVDGIAAYTLCNLANLFPAPIVNYLIKYISNIAAGVTNIGGIRGMKLAGCNVEASFGFMPEFYNTRFLIVVYTYNDRFHLSLSTVEGVLYNQEEVQEVLDDVLDYIGKLSHELDVKLN